jgi:hypothetical protein
MERANVVADPADLQRLAELLREPVGMIRRPEPRVTEDEFVHACARASQGLRRHREGGELTWNATRRRPRSFARPIPRRTSRPYESPDLRTAGDRPFPGPQGKTAVRGSTGKPRGFNPSAGLPLSRSVRARTTAALRARARTRAAGPASDEARRPQALPRLRRADRVPLEALSQVRLPRAPPRAGVTSQLHGAVQSSLTARSTSLSPP